MTQYIRKVFPHDLTHEVSFTQYIHSVFFHGSYNMTFFKGTAHTKYYVTANDATDLRFGGDFKSMLPVGLSIGDFICIENTSNGYSLSVIAKHSDLGKAYNLLLGPRQRHLLFSNCVLVYKA